LLIVIEGVNGVGKTTLAKSLSEYLGIRIFKPFRTDHDIHWGTGHHLEQSLARFGVPVNSHQEDFFIADFLATYTEAEAILDRGMPSAVGYGMARGDIGEADGAAMLLWWFDRLMSNRDVHYIYLGCSPQASLERAGERSQQGASLEVIDGVMASAWILAKKRSDRPGSPHKALRFDTTDSTPEALFGRVCDWL
jgi:thymidylate kinase